MCIDVTLGRIGYAGFCSVGFKLVDGFRRHRALPDRSPPISDVRHVIARNTDPPSACPPPRSAERRGEEAEIVRETDRLHVLARPRTLFGQTNSICMERSL